MHTLLTHSWPAGAVDDGTVRTEAEQSLAVVGGAVCRRLPLWRRVAGAEPTSAGVGSGRQAVRRSRKQNAAFDSPKPGVG